MKAKELLERCLAFIDWMKSEQGEINDDNLGNDIIAYLESLEKDTK